MKEILDDFNYDDPDPRKMDKIVIRNGIITSCVFIALYYLRVNFPENLMEFDNAESFLIGLMIIAVMVIAVRLTISSLHEIDNKKRSITLALLGGATIFFADFIYKIILYFLILGYGMQTNLISLLIGSLILSLYGFFYGYVRASKIKKENTIIPNLLLIGFFVCMALFNKYLF